VVLILGRSSFLLAMSLRNVRTSFPTYEIWSVRPDYDDA
jgi:hypothetical protein